MFYLDAKLKQSVADAAAGKIVEHMISGWPSRDLWTPELVEGHRALEATVKANLEYYEWAYRTWTRTRPEFQESARLEP